LEARTPFLDKQFVAVAQSIATMLRRPVKGTQCEKWILREAFSNSGLLPEEILWRKKEAFSDGVSSMNRSWFTIIQESIPEEIQQKYVDTSITLEQFYYRTLYKQHYTADVLPYYWMPKYTTTKDCSARTLENYI
jgi:asparagine synthase (glutamine-hydrolysing)